MPFVNDKLLKILMADAVQVEPFPLPNSLLAGKKQGILQNHGFCRRNEALGKHYQRGKNRHRAMMLIPLPAALY
jgi:hypothetical protein